MNTLTYSKAIYEFWYYPGEHLTGRNFKIFKTVRGVLPKESAMVTIVGPFTELRLLKKDFLQRLGWVIAEIDKNMDLITFIKESDIKIS